MTGPGRADEPTPQEIMNDPAASFWLKNALRSALDRDPVDAAGDAEVLSKVLSGRLRRLLRS